MHRVCNLPDSGKEKEKAKMNQYIKKVSCHPELMRVDASRWDGSGGCNILFLFFFNIADLTKYIYDDRNVRLHFSLLATAFLLSQNE